jgi:hypothetical protein
VPKSRIRRQSAYTPPPKKAPVRVGSPRWLAPTMVGLFIVGLLWIVVYYVTQTSYPIPGIHHWNLAIGFAMIAGGFVLSTRWK